jgi:YegS/Rv2252/BmrU family lipid kinase
MTRSLVIINPRAGGGRARRVWQQHADYIRARLGDVEAVETDSQDDVADVLHSASRRGVTRVISIGGDGTNHYSVNAILRHNRAHPHHPLTYASLPAGTGRDWSRGAAMPLNVPQAVDWIANTRLRYVDVGRAVLDGQERLFLNASSVGISGEVVKRVDASQKGGRITFLRAILGALLAYRPTPMQIDLDGQRWLEGPVYLAAVCNGRFFGQGLKVAPNAEIDDGLFDMVAAGDLSLPMVLRLLQRMYGGTHIFSPHVQLQRGHTVTITSTAPLGLDLDGEGAVAQQIHYSILPQALGMHT